MQDVKFAGHQELKYNLHILHSIDGSLVQLPNPVVPWLLKSLCLGIAVYKQAVGSFVGFTRVKGMAVVGCKRGKTRLPYQELFDSRDLKYVEGSDALSS